LIIFYWIAYLTGINSKINELNFGAHICFTASVIIVVFAARWLSKKLFISWFYEVLKNLEIYFKTKNINNNGNNTN